MWLWPGQQDEISSRGLVEAVVPVKWAAAAAAAVAGVAGVAGVAAVKWVAAAAAATDKWMQLNPDHINVHWGHTCT